MDAYQVFLGRPCLFDRRVMYNGYLNTFSLKKYGKKITLTLISLLQLQKTKPHKSENQSKVLLLGEGDVDTLRRLAPKGHQASIHGTQASKFQEKHRTRQPCSRFLQRIVFLAQRFCPVVCTLVWLSSKLKKPSLEGKDDSRGIGPLKGLL